MTKRSWDEANAGGSPGTSPQQRPDCAVDGTSTPREPSDALTIRSEASRPASTETAVPAGDFSGSLEHVPSISRKIKACAACRKQKIRCLMEDGPPCHRCREKDLSCVLNKSLQTLIAERMPASDVVIDDLEMLHANIQTIFRALNIPSQGNLKSARHPIVHTPVSVEHRGLDITDNVGPSCDNSPKLSPEDDLDLPHVPIQSIYHLTKLRALCSPESSHDAAQNGDLAREGDDLISRGLLQLRDAERLFRLYTDRLDNYIYNVGARYSSLDALRRASPILTAAILTVGAQHDQASNHIYPVCNREFRRLMTDSLFDRQIDRDHLRALCIATYWLNDASWVLSGVAARRATSFGITTQFRRLVESNDEDAADFVRIWYLIYICDQHLSTVYGRECTTREDEAVQGWELMVKASTTTTGDLRLISQIALLTIIHNIRELFGSDAEKPIPVVFVTQIKGFAQQLDQWVGHWTTTFPEHQEGFGTFPRKGALFHFQFAKLFLYSHVFRGPRNAPAIPPAFLEAAHGAVTAALSILKMILTDEDVRSGLVGLPCYIQSMIGFACMSLVKLTSIHGDDLVQRETVIDLLSKLVVVYRNTPVGRWHLIPLMAEGLEKMVHILQKRQGDLVGGGSRPGNGVVGLSRPMAGTRQSIPSSANDLIDLGSIGHVDISTMNLDTDFLMNTGLSMGMGMDIGLGGAPEQSLFGIDFDFGQSLL